MKAAKKFAVIDAETDPFDGVCIPAPFIWGFFDGDNYESFDTTESLVAAISNFNGIVYAHNGGKFDFHFLLPDIEPYEEIMIINGRISKMRLGKCELRDSYNIIPAPLSAYIKDDFDYRKMHRDVRKKHMKEIKVYLKNDCIYLHQLVSRFIEDNGLSLTQAGASMKHWKKLSITEVPETDREFYDEFKNYYYGGRVQCFEKGIINTDFAVYDINSAYPFAMLSKHPYSANCARYDGFKANADFYRLTCIANGCFPFREKTGLTFPNDTQIREYSVTGWELEAAVDTQSIRDADFIESVIFCGHTDFSEYVNHFYALRNEAKQKNDKAGSLLYKLAMNSLYGKFAANPENYRNYMAFPFSHAAGMSDYGWKFAGEFGPWALGESNVDEERQHYYNVATGASITGFVRAMLWRAIYSSSGLLYCDTDSLAVRCADALPIGDNLGQWKCEGNFNRAGIAGKKLYVFQNAEKGGENKTASKGVRLTENQLWDLAAGETIKYHPQAPTFTIRGKPHFIDRSVAMT